MPSGRTRRWPLRRWACVCYARSCRADLDADFWVSPLGRPAAGRHSVAPGAQAGRLRPVRLLVRRPATLQQLILSASLARLRVPLNGFHASCDAPFAVPARGTVGGFRFGFPRAPVWAKCWVGSESQPEQGQGGDGETGAEFGRKLYGDNLVLVRGHNHRQVSARMDNPLVVAGGGLAANRHVFRSGRQLLRHAAGFLRQSASVSPRTSSSTLFMPLSGKSPLVACAGVDTKPTALRAFFSGPSGLKLPLRRRAGTTFDLDR